MDFVPSYVSLHSHRVPALEASPSFPSPIEVSQQGGAGSNQIYFYVGFVAIEQTREMG